MRNPEQTDFPTWAREERQGDLNWIEENLNVFWEAAIKQHDQNGRGIVVVDLRSRPPGGHYFTYYIQQFIEWEDDEDIKQMVVEYNPAHEFIVALIKSTNRLSIYRVEPNKQMVQGPWTVDSDDSNAAVESRTALQTEEERLEEQEDLSWINSNRRLFWLVATVAHEQIGRGAIIVDTTANAPWGKGNPFDYQAKGELQLEDEALNQLLQTYMPDREFVIVLLKAEERFNCYLGNAPILGWWTKLHTDTKRYI